MRLCVLRLVAIVKGWPHWGAETHKACLERGLTYAGARCGYAQRWQRILEFGMRRTAR